MIKLVILESPNKIQKVQKYLNNIDKNNKYIVKASVGYFRELANSGDYKLGININSIEGDWIISGDKSKNVKELIQLFIEVDEVILATYPDREGEVISWHLYKILSKSFKRLKGVKLNSITEREVKKQINQLSNLDLNYVNSGLSRTYLDKITGYILSKILQDQNIGVSAGRVQSSILKILANRENDFLNFKKEKWFILEDNLKVKFQNVEKNDSKWKLKKYRSFNETLNIKNKLLNKYMVKDILENKFEDKAFINFTTADYLQACKKKKNINQRCY